MVKSVLIHGLLALACAAAVAACGEESSPQAPSTDAADVVDLQEETSENPGPPDTQGTPDLSEPEVEEPPAPAPYNPGTLLRRLTGRAYDRTVADLLGSQLTPSDDFPADIVAHGFDHLSEHTSVSPLLFEAWANAAEVLASEAMTRTPPALFSLTLEAEEADIPESFPEPGVGVVLYTGTPADFPVVLPADDVYEIALDVFGTAGDGATLTMLLQVDGQTKGSWSVFKDPDADPITKELELTGGAHVLSLIFTSPTPPDPDTPIQDQEWSNAHLLHVDKLEVKATTHMVDEPDPADAFILCDPDDIGAEACATEALTELATRAWRRPLNDGEIAPLVGLVTSAVDDGRGFDRGMRVALEALLLSPHFLFFVEPPSDDGEERAATDHELATRLSYFLWNSLPDEGLREAADLGLLSDPFVLKGQAQRLLDDPRSEGLVESLARQWLMGRGLEKVQPDAETYPDFDPALRRSMAEETRRFLKTFIDEDRAVGELLDSSDLHLDERLGDHYGIPVLGDQFKEITDHDTDRGGLLAQGAILTALSPPNRTSPTRRGKWILETFLCVPVGDPPPGVAEDFEIDKDSNLTAAALLELHTSDPACAGCHDLMDPLGFGLEAYDGIGAWRKTETGQTVGKVPDGNLFQGVRAMSEQLATDDRLGPCVADALFRYAMARLPTSLDYPRLDEIKESWLSGELGFRSLLVEIATSEALRTVLPIPANEEEP